MAQCHIDTPLNYSSLLMIIVVIFVDRKQSHTQRRDVQLAVLFLVSHFSNVNTFYQLNSLGTDHDFVTRFISC